MQDYVVCGQWRKFGQQKAFQKGIRSQQDNDPPNRTLPVPFGEKKPWGTTKKGDFSSFLKNWKTHCKWKFFPGLAEKGQGEDEMWGFIYLIPVKKTVRVRG